MIQGHRYLNPNAGFELEVVRPDTTQLSGAGLQDLAWQYQYVISEALLDQYDGVFSAADVSHTADPFDDGMVQAQAARLLTAGSAPPDATYFHGRIVEGDDSWYLVSVGKAKYADGRRRAVRLTHGDPVAAANLADVGDVFVATQPMDPPGCEIRGMGVGSATLHAMLDKFPDSMETVVYDYPAENPRIVPLLQGLGFNAIGRSRRVEFCGTMVEQAQFRGRPVGELRGELEQRRPWLRDRQPITVNA